MKINFNLKEKKAMMRLLTAMTDRITPMVLQAELYSQPLPDSSARRAFMSYRMACIWSMVPRIEHTWNSWWLWPMISNRPGLSRSGRWLAYRNAARRANTNCRAWMNCDWSRHSCGLQRKRRYKMGILS